MRSIRLELWQLLRLMLRLMLRLNLVLWLVLWLVLRLRLMLNLMLVLVLSLMLRLRWRLLRKAGARRRKGRKGHRRCKNVLRYLRDWCLRLGRYELCRLRRW